MSIDIKKDTDQLSERIDALEIVLLMFINSMQGVKVFEIDGVSYNVIGSIPKATLKMMEQIIVKK